MIDQIRRYRVKGQIGQGAMAIVYEAYDPRIDRPLAIKILREERCVDKEYIVRFLREAKAVGNLSHPHIVTIYDVDEHEKRPFIVMELLEGTPLNEVMKPNEAHDIKDVISIGIQLASALDYAHNRGIVHRDIKPSNIVMSDKDNSIKITDFGIAHFADNDLTHQTNMGVVLGTPQYMSPEQVEGTKVDGRSDLFSIGVILYQLLAGERPFTGDTVATLMYQITSVTPKPLEVHNPKVPNNMRKIIARLLEKKPKDRFQSGVELKQALISVLQEIKYSNTNFNANKIIPIRLKWSLLMAAFVSMIMITSIAVIFERQYQAMSSQMYEYGNAMVQFAAAESAVPVLSEDWVAVELFVAETSQRQNFSYLTVVDQYGKIRGSNLTKQIGKEFSKPKGIKFEQNKNLIRIISDVLGKRQRDIDFSAPIVFQKKQIGEVHLGIKQRSFQALAKQSFYMMLILLVITITVVVSASYALGKYFSSSLSTIKNALEEIKAGRYFHRINKKRNDEFGQLYNTFDEMAEAVQKSVPHKKRPQKRHSPYIPKSASTTQTDLASIENEKTQIIRK